MPQVAALYRHPVKGMAPQPHERLTVLDSGPVAGDRVLGLLFANAGEPDFGEWWHPKKMLTLKNAPGLALLGASLDAGGTRLEVTLDGKTLVEAALDEAGRERIATAVGSVIVAPETMRLIAEGEVKKGDVLSVARLAGIMGAKKTPELIPLCHPLALNGIDVDLTLDPARNEVDITATCRVTGRTGVEMEALTVVAVAALTIYDMCKAVDRARRIDGVRLVRKTGGKSGDVFLE